MVRSPVLTPVLRAVLTFEAYKINKIVIRKVIGSTNLAVSFSADCLYATIAQNNAFKVVWLRSSWYLWAIDTKAYLA